MGFSDQQYSSSITLVIRGEKDTNCRYRRLEVSESFQAWGDMIKTVFFKVNSGNSVSIIIRYIYIYMDSPKMFYIIQKLFDSQVVHN